jgi:bifunctional DNase/RNase
MRKTNNTVDVFFNKIVAIKDIVCAVLFDGASEKIIETEEFEGALLSFHFTTYSNFAYVKTIYQLFLNFLISSGYQITLCSIEEYIDGLGYCKINLTKNKKTIYFATNIIDGLILAAMSKTPIRCNVETWEELEDYDGDDNEDCIEILPDI